jgi:hypothetical protein
LAVTRSAGAGRSVAARVRVLVAFARGRVAGEVRGGVLGRQVLGLHRFLRVTAWVKHLRCRVFARQPFGFGAHPKPWLPCVMWAVQPGEQAKEYVLADPRGINIAFGVYS